MNALQWLCNSQIETTINWVQHHVKKKQLQLLFDSITYVTKSWWEHSFSICHLSCLNQGNHTFHLKNQLFSQYFTTSFSFICQCHDENHNQEENLFAR